MNGRVGFVIVTASSRSSEFAINKTRIRALAVVTCTGPRPNDLLFGVLTPLIIRELFLNQLLQINGLVELICLGTGIADVSLGIKCLGDLHDGLTVYAKKTTAHHLKINRGQRKRSPFAFWFLVHFCHFRPLCHEAPLQHHCDSCTIKKVNTSPEEIDLFAFPLKHDLDAPEGLGFEILNSEVSINHESQCGELA